MCVDGVLRPGGTTTLPINLVRYGTSQERGLSTEIAHYVQVCQGASPKHLKAKRSTMRCLTSSQMQTCNTMPDGLHYTAYLAGM